MPLTPHSRVLVLDEAIELSKREPPKIGGSFGGFIALIVCLCLVIAITCCGIFYLLRYHEPNDAERAVRRTKKYQEEGGYDPTSIATYGSGRPSTPMSLPAKFASLLGFGGGRSSAKNARTPGAAGGGMKLGRGAAAGGWVQAGSGDEWDDSDSGDEGGHPRQPGSGGNTRTHRPKPKHLTEMSLSVSTDKGGVYAPPLDTPFRPPHVSMMSSDSSSTVQFDMNHGHSNASTPRYYGRDRHHDASPSPQPSLPTSRMNSMASDISPPSPSSDVPRLRSSGSPEPMPGFRDSRPGTPRSDGNGPLSASSTRTFSGGTKFIEGL